MVIEIDEERRRISLGIKQCKSNPWAEFAGTFNRGDKVSGQIKSITDFGIFIGLDGGIDGLVHLVRHFLGPARAKKRCAITRKARKLKRLYWRSTLNVNASRLVSSSSRKDPFSGWLAAHPKNSIVTGTVTEVDARGATVDLGDGVDMVRCAHLNWLAVGLRTHAR